MSRVLVMVVLMLVLAAVIIAGGSYFALALGGRARLSGETSVDFGTLEIINFTPVERSHVFRLTNKSKEALTIAGVSADCGCTYLVAPTGKAIQSGETVEIQTKTSFAVPGGKTVKVKLLFDDGTIQYLRIDGYGKGVRREDLPSPMEANDKIGRVPVAPRPDLDFDALDADTSDPTSASPSTQPDVNPLELPQIPGATRPAETQPAI